jgi:ABC-type nitrate/sulfonate/bicarbonate transport system permease component
MESGPTQPLTRAKVLAYGGAGLVLFFALWGALSFTGTVPRQFLPTPLDLCARFVQLLTTPFAGATLPQHLGSSFFRFGCGFLLGAAIGIPLGLLMGWFPTLDEIVTPIFDALRFIAPRAFPPCLINAYRGARFVSRPLVEAAQMLGTNNLRIIGEVLLPASTASIIAGLRVSAGLGWQSLIGAELIVASTGIGFMMVQAQLNISTATVMSGMVAIGIVGLLIDVALRSLEAEVRRRGLA